MACWVLFLGEGTAGVERGGEKNRGVRGLEAYFK